MPYTKKNFNYHKGPHESVLITVKLIYTHTVQVKITGCWKDTVDINF